MQLSPDERAQLERYRRAERQDYILARVIGIPLIIASVVVIAMYFTGYL